MTQRIHGTSKARQEPLYDLDIPTPSHAELARTLAVTRQSGTLCTLSQICPGYPHGSLVTLAWQGARPILLMSDLAEHTKNLRADPRCSLMVSQSDGQDPLALGRLTAVGRAKIVAQDDEAARQAYLSAHPQAKYYSDYSDFCFWEISVEQVRYIGGFGRMSWVQGQDWAHASPDPLREQVAGICEHMNQDHHRALVDYCKAFSKAGQVEQVKMTHVDRYGFEMSVNTPEGWRPVRIAFEAPCETPDQVRAALVRMAKAARAS